jgi:hypothetical protein
VVFSFYIVMRGLDPRMTGFELVVLADVPVNSD